MSRTALVTGITGQDGSYLAELLLQKGYAVHGVTRHASSLNRGRIGHLAGTDAALTLHHGDLADAPTLQRLVQQVRPDEIYNLAAQSHVGVSFELPGYTMDCNALGTLRLLEAVRTLGLGGTTRFYQASTSEMFGAAATSPQTESTPFEPRSPYGVAKLAAHWIARNYREAYGVFACCGILFNHESPRRGESFVSRKITRALTRMHLGLQDVLELGNLDAERDFGHARDYVEAQWLMLQQPQPDDYVIATGKRHSVRAFVVAAAAALDLGLRWEGEGADERAVAATVPSGSGIRSGQTVVRLDPRHVRPIDVPALCGDAGKARRVLGWTPRTGFDALVREMMASDLALAQREARAG